MPAGVVDMDRLEGLRVAMLSEFQLLRDEMRSEFRLVHARIDLLDENLSERISALEIEVGGVKTRVTLLETRVTGLEKRVTGLEDGADSSDRNGQE